VRVYTKGAPDVLFADCTHVLDDRGVRVPADSTTTVDEPELWKLPGMPDLEVEHEGEILKKEVEMNEETGKEVIKMVTDRTETYGPRETFHLDTYIRTVKLFAD